MADDDIGDVHVDVIADLTQFERNLKSKLQRIGDSIGASISSRATDSMNKSLAKKTIKFNPKFDFTKAEGKFQGWFKRIERMGPTFQPKVEGAPRAEGILSALARERIVYITALVNDVSMRKFGKEITTLFQNVVGLGIISLLLQKIVVGISQIGVLGPVIAAAGAAFFVLAGGILAAGGGIVNVINDLGSLWALLLPLPGIILNIALAAKVMSLALKDADKVIGDLAPQYQELQKVISDNFWKQAEAPIRRLSAVIFPQLSKVVDMVSDGMGRLTGAFADSLASEFANGGLERMFAGLVPAIDILITGTDSFANIIQKLGEIGSRYLPRLAQFFVDIADAFSGWLDRMDASGELDRMINTAIENLKALGGVIREISRIFLGIGEAATAAGGTGLQGLRDNLKIIADTIMTPVFQKALTTFFEGGRAALEGLLPAITSLGDLLAFLAPTIASAMEKSGDIIGRVFAAVFDALATPAIADGITAVIDGLVAGLEGLIPYLPAISDGLASVMTVIGELAKAALPEIGALFAGIAGIFQTLAVFITPVIQGLGLILEPLINIIGAIGPLFVPVGLAFVAILGAMKVSAGLSAIAMGIFGKSLIGLNVVQKLTTVFGLFNKVLLANPILKVVSIIALLVAAFVALYTQSETFRNAVQPVVDLLAFLGEEVLGKLMAALDPLIDTLIGALMPIFEALMPIVGLLANLLGIVLGGALALLLPIIDIFTGALMLIAPVIEFLASLIAAWIQTLVALFTGDFASIEGIWSGIWEQVTGFWESYVMPAMEAIGQFFTDLWTNVTTFFQEAWQNANDWFMGILESISSFFMTIWNNLVSWFRTLLMGIVTFYVGIWTGIGTFFTNLWQGIVRGFMSLWDGVRSWWAGLLGGIADTWTRIWTGIRDGFRGILNGILGGIENMVNGAIRTLNTLVTGVNTVSGAIGIPAIPKIPLVNIPSLAKGATIMPRIGGTLTRLAEAGRPESVVDTGLMNKLIEQVLHEFPKQVQALKVPVGAGALNGSGGNTTSMVENNYNFDVDNPVPEKVSETVPKAIRKAAYVE